MNRLFDFPLPHILDLDNVLVMLLVASLGGYPERALGLGLLVNG